VKTTLDSRRAILPADAAVRTRSTARRATRSVVDLVADIRTLTGDADDVIAQRDQALRALAATVVAIREGWSTPELFALPVLTKLGLVPQPGADPHEILAGAPWWASVPGSAARDLHADDEVGGGLRRLAVLPVDVHAPQLARRLLAAVAADWALPAVAAADAGSVVSELVTNAVLHARWDEVPADQRAIPVEIAWGPDRRELALTVGDLDPRLPELRTEPGKVAVLSPATRAGEGGAGLHIVAALTTRWFANAAEDGKSVTAVIATGTAGGAR
jgi:anti-sigma regulatory factor (Ser/Thr protein kinase)